MLVGPSVQSVRQSKLCAVIALAIDRNRPVAVFKTVAIWTLVHAASVRLLDALDFRFGWLATVAMIVGMAASGVLTSNGSHAFSIQIELHGDDDESQDERFGDHHRPVPEQDTKNEPEGNAGSERDMHPQ
jgi:hypothetical protein